MDIPERNQGFVYVIRNRHTNLVKIGITKNLKRRIKQLKKKYGDIEIINTFHSKLYNITEKHLHNYYKKYHIKLELFDLPNNAIYELRNLDFRDRDFQNIIHGSITGSIFFNLPLVTTQNYSFRP